MKKLILIFMVVLVCFNVNALVSKVTVTLTSVTTPAWSQKAGIDPNTEVVISFGLGRYLYILKNGVPIKTITFPAVKQGSQGTMVFTREAGDSYQLHLLVDTQFSATWTSCDENCVSQVVGGYYTVIKRADNQNNIACDCGAGTVATMSISPGNMDANNRIEFELGNI